MIFDNWKAARRYIAENADRVELHAIAGMFRDQKTDTDFLQFCRAFEKVANALNRIDWRTDVPTTEDKLNANMQALDEALTNITQKGNQ